MKEVLSYFETQKSGIVGFHQMKQGWVEVSQKINSGASLKLKDPEQTNALYSPKEWPAKYLNELSFKSNSSFKTLKIEKLTVKIAG